MKINPECFVKKCVFVLKLVLYLVFMIMCPMMKHLVDVFYGYCRILSIASISERPSSIGCNELVYLVFKKHLVVQQIVTHLLQLDKKLYSRLDSQSSFLVFANLLWLAR